MCHGAIGIEHRVGGRDAERVAVAVGRRRVLARLEQRIALCEEKNNTTA